MDVEEKESGSFALAISPHTHTLYNGEGELERNMKIGFGCCNYTMPHKFKCWYYIIYNFTRMFYRKNHYSRLNVSQLCRSEGLL